MMITIIHVFNPLFIKTTPNAHLHVMGHPIIDQSDRSYRFFTFHSYLYIFHLHNLEFPYMSRLSVHDRYDTTILTHWHVCLLSLPFLLLSHFWTLPLEEMFHRTFSYTECLKTAILATKIIIYPLKISILAKFIFNNILYKYFCWRKNLQSSSLILVFKDIWIKNYVYV